MQVRNLLFLPNLICFHVFHNSFQTLTHTLTDNTRVQSLQKAAHDTLTIPKRGREVAINL
jgi:hypothetical protein